PDGTIDTCKLTKPPKEAYVENAGHSFRSFTYPNPYKIPSNYTGCAKGWLGDYGSNPKSFLVISMRFNGGLLLSAEAYDPDGLVASCEYDKNEMIIKSHVVERTGESCEDLLSSARRVVKREK
ncbi:MAG: hypothetical protein PHD12_10830, partial [Methylotenera sp.]|nr:hypothetical protein [Methylotenera sp.]